MDESNDSNAINRREFIAATAAAAAAVSLGGCGAKNDAKTMSEKSFGVPEPTPAQRARKRQGRSTVGIIRCASYDDDILANIEEHRDKLHLPDLKNKRVVLKPNMVEIQPGHPITTHPAVLAAAVKLADKLGAREIIVAEGPGHMRDTEMLLLKSGLGQMIKKLGVPFVDLNLDDLVKVDQQDSFTGLKAVYMPKTIMTADAVVSVPKMKTHHWVGVTASMKNLFGTVPGRKYGWPKNLLHIKGIPRWILDLQHIVNPTFAVVDAIVAMEGDGPINGTAKETGFVVVGTDLAAVDATCVRTMQIAIHDLPYIRAAGEVVGNIDESMIDIVGASIDSVKQEFKKPITLLDRSMLANAAHQGS